MPVSTSVIARSLKNTLEQIVTDTSDKLESEAVFPRWMDVMGMKDHYEDDLEVGGPGLASEFGEGAEMPLGTIREGYVERYIARKFGLKIIVTEEALEDGKYKQVINAAKRCKRALWKTADVDAALLLIRAENASYTFGDGVSLASASHTLPDGSTFSNTMATPLSPSRGAVIEAWTAVRKLPGHDGVVTDNLRLKDVICPVDQGPTWDVIMGSSKAPEAGQYNAINVVSQNYKLGKVENVYWDTTTTNYAYRTTAENGFSFRWRRKPRSRSWGDNDQELTKWGISARWARSISDKRGVYFVGA